MSIGSFVNRLVPTAISFVTGGPVAAASTLVGTDQALDQQKKARLRNAAMQKQYKENMTMAMDPSQMIGQRSQFISSQPQQLGFFERIGNLGSQVGNTLLSGLEAFVPQALNRAVFGDRPASAGQGPAITTVTNVGAQESQGSGSIQAGAGALLPNILGGARSLLKSPMGQLALGGGATALTFMGGTDKKPRITRKMKSQARMVLNLTGGNIPMAADILNISEDMLIGILLKRFRNDGPMITKAAMRKTKQTIRRLHNMQDVLKSITPTAAGRRRAPMKRATTTTLIKN
jgi:hypothetical protein